jgi:hypothetical protein
MLLVRAAEGLAAGLLLAALLAVGGVRSNAILLVVAGALAGVRMVLGDQWRFGWWRSLPRIAERLERRTSKPKNLLVTASELSGGGRSYVHDAVMSRAARLTSELDVNELLPAQKAIGAAMAGVIVLAATVFQPRVASNVNRLLPNRTSVPSIRRVDVTVIPPAYSGQQRTSSSNPSRIDALVGSRIEIGVEATAASVVLETLSGTQNMSRAGDTYSVTLNAATDGFLAIEPRDSAGRAGVRQLIGLSVTPDAAPSVKLTAPGRDLFFTTVPDTLSVAIHATDDLALSSLVMKYTAVSGSGERFTFTEREVPLTVSKANPASWSARGTWRLDQLGLEAGDMLVYRAVATDSRPRSAPVESESYVLEVVTPGALAAEGFAADDQRDRYAVSQQMVILKTERLIARRRSLDPDSLGYESRTLAAEQRQVRAEFVFMMGGELEDATTEETSGTLELNEATEAESESDILAGRMANRGRVEMTRAIRAMSRASAALNESNLDQALRDERIALDNLMRAFARSRFILRALTQRERIDLERRLSGSLNLTAGLSGPTAEASVDSRITAMRRLLADLAAGDSAAIRTSALTVLRETPGSGTLQRLVMRVQEQPRDRTRVDSLLSQLSLMIAGAMPTNPAPGTPLGVGLLEGALRDATRREGRRP